LISQQSKGDEEMTLTSEDPYRGLVSLHDRLARLLDEPGWYPVLSRGARSTGVWVPPVDIYENPDGLVIRADLPGLAKEEVKINLEGNVLTLQGERKSGIESKERAYHRTERPAGRFNRSFTLPVDLDTHSIEATFTQGVLTIKIPKSAEAKPRTVEIR
jgi:HSP20 family protein